MAKLTFGSLNDKRSSKHGANAGRPGGGTNDSGAYWRLYIWSVNRDRIEQELIAPQKDDLPEIEQNHAA
jgi:hypothetical protein